MLVYQPKPVSHALLIVSDYKVNLIIVTQAMRVNPKKLTKSF